MSVASFYLDLVSVATARDTRRPPSHLDFDNLPPTAGTEGSKEVEGKRPGCQFHGASFKDGDTFPSNRTGLRPTRQDQCVMCVCTVRCPQRTYMLMCGVNYSVKQSGMIV